MAQAVLDTGRLPEAALEAASTFHAEWLPQAVQMLASEIENLAIVLPQAPYDHTGWRRAAARDLARAYAPKRINIIGSCDARATAASLAYLDGALGVTGHYLPLGGTGGGGPLPEDR